MTHSRRPARWIGVRRGVDVAVKKIKKQMTQRELDKVRFEVDILTYVLTDVSQRARVHRSYLSTHACA